MQRRRGRACSTTTAAHATGMAAAATTPSSLQPEGTAYHACSVCNMYAYGACSIGSLSAFRDLKRPDDRRGLCVLRVRVELTWQPS